jgi:8-oxo-dGTP pyrophosphatase MutT (NUDIX family)
VLFRSKLWNGPFFLFEAAGFDGGAFRALARPTDYATFLEWRGRGFPGDHHTHIFPVPALTTADRRLLVGVMGRSTANAGLAYPPSGSFDHLDVVGERLDPVANMVRELAEEVGIDAADFAPDPGFTVIASGPRRLALVKRWRTPLPAADLAAAIDDHLGRESDPELSGFDFVAFDARLDPARTAGYVNPLLALLEASA